MSHREAECNRYAADTAFLQKAAYHGLHVGMVGVGMTVLSEMADYQAGYVAESPAHDHAAQHPFHRARSLPDILYEKYRRRVGIQHVEPGRGQSVDYGEVSSGQPALGRSADIEWMRCGEILHRQTVAHDAHQRTRRIMLRAFLGEISFAIGPWMEATPAADTAWRGARKCQKKPISHFGLSRSIHSSMCGRRWTLP